MSFQYKNRNISRLIVCSYCNGTGKVTEYNHYKDTEVEGACPKCRGEGRLFQNIKIETRPVNGNDMYTLRRLING